MPIQPAILMPSQFLTVIPERLYRGYGFSGSTMSSLKFRNRDCHPRVVLSGIWF